MNQSNIWLELLLQDFEIYEGRQLTVWISELVLSIIMEAITKGFLWFYISTKNNLFNIHKQTHMILFVSIIVFSFELIHVLETYN